MKRLAVTCTALVALCFSAGTAFPQTADDWAAAFHARHPQQGVKTLDELVPPDPPLPPADPAWETEKSGTAATEADETTLSDVATVFGESGGVAAPPQAEAVQMDTATAASAASASAVPADWMEKAAFGFSFRLPPDFKQADTRNDDEIGFFSGDMATRKGVGLNVTLIEDPAREFRPDGEMVPQSQPDVTLANGMVFHRVIVDAKLKDGNTLYLDAVYSDQQMFEGKHVGFLWAVINEPVADHEATHQTILSSLSHVQDTAAPPTAEPAAKMTSIFGGLVELPIPSEFGHIFEDEDRFSATSDDYTRAIGLARGYAITRDIGWLAEIPPDASQTVDNMMGQMARVYFWKTSEGEEGQTKVSFHRVWILNDCLLEKGQPLGVRLDGDEAFVDGSDARGFLNPMKLTQKLVPCARDNAPTAKTPEPGTGATEVPPPAPDAGADTATADKTVPPVVMGEQVRFMHLSFNIPQGWQRLDGTPDNQPRYASPGATAETGMTIMLVAEDPQLPGQPGTTGVDVLSTRVVTMDGHKATLETWHHAETDSFGQTLSLPDIEPGKVIRIVAWTPRREWSGSEPVAQAIFASVSAAKDELSPPPVATPDDATTEPPSQTENETGTDDGQAAVSPNPALRPGWQQWDLTEIIFATPNGWTPFGDPSPLSFSGDDWEVALAERTEAVESGALLVIGWQREPSLYSAGNDATSTQAAHLGDLDATRFNFEVRDKYNNTKGFDVIANAPIAGRTLFMTCRMPIKAWKKQGRTCEDVLATLIATAPPPSAPAKPSDTTASEQTQGTEEEVGKLHTPAKGSAERKLILDTARGPLSKDLGKSLVMIVQTLNTDGHWAYLQARPLSADGTSPFDWSGTPYAEYIRDGSASDILMVLLVKRGSAWRVVNTAIAPSDVAWSTWVDTYHLPERLFQHEAQ